MPWLKTSAMYYNLHLGPGDKANGQAVLQWLSATVPRGIYSGRVYFETVG